MAAKAGGISTSTRLTQACIDVLPRIMFSIWPASSPTVSVASAIRTSNTPSPRSVMPATSPTISASTRASSMAASGISTLCSTAMPRARSSISSAGQQTW